LPSGEDPKLPDQGLPLHWHSPLAEIVCSTFLCAAPTQKCAHSKFSLKEAAE
jgi:hypothetical protein